MQREIKFRFWDKNSQRLEYVDFYEPDWKLGEIPVMQFTGLHDKNGKEIYEGDIVVLGNWKPKEIVFEGGSGFAGFKLKDTDFFLMGHDTNRLEVIGNIYENPLLIKSTL